MFFRNSADPLEFLGQINKLLCVMILLASTGTSTLVYADGRDDGFVSIFDGKTLDGWTGKSQFWSVVDGAITGRTTEVEPTKGNTFLIYDQPVGNFELHLKVKILNGNSGIQFRSVDMGNSVVYGYQTDVDSTEKYLGDLYDEGGDRGILARGGESGAIGVDGKKTLIRQLHDRSEIAAVVRWQDWNDYVVTARGNRITQQINNLTVVEFTDDQEGKARKAGILALQLHAGPPMLVQFKDIRLKRY